MPTAVTLLSAGLLFGVSVPALAVPVAPLREAVYEKLSVPSVPVAETAVPVGEICGATVPTLPVAIRPLCWEDVNAVGDVTPPVPVAAVSDPCEVSDPKLTALVEATPLIASEENLGGKPSKLTSENAVLPNNILRDVDQRSTGSVGWHDERERTRSHSLCAEGVSRHSLVALGRVVHQHAVKCGAQRHVGIRNR